MRLEVGARLGPYEIVAPIGAGGMGEVFRAHDTKLDRDVAIKVLPESMARDPDRLARFEREAKALAAITHPNIAQVFGLEDGAIVMELLEGETLRSRLEGGPLPVRKVIEMGAQLARGLAAAHERGIVHRDLKPDNVFLLRDGRVKILDFGLVRQAPATPTEATVTAPIVLSTDPGTVMGTASYMSPEQVRAEALDGRSDLFALGVVLYEMLTGLRAFTADTTAETMAAILKAEALDLSAARPDVSPALDRIVRHCLEKNPIERFQTARDVAFALDSLSGSAATPSPMVAAPRRVRERWVWAAVTAALAVVALGQGLMSRLQPPPVPPAVYRAVLPLPSGVTLASAIPPALRLAVSPDGRRVAFVGVATSNQTQALWLLSFDEPEARQVAGTEGGLGPFWSPDSRRLAFTLRDALKVVNVDGGAPVDFGPPGIGDWSAAGELLLSGGPPTFSMRRVSADGQHTVDLLTPGPGEFYAGWSVLSDGRRVLFGYRNTKDDSTSGVYVATTDLTDRKLVLADNQATSVRYAAGFLTIVRDSTLMAQAFDESTLKLTGDLVPIADGVDALDRGSAVSLSRTGTLVYSSSVDQSLSRLVWMDRTGRVLSHLGDEADYSNVELSPDGNRVLVSVTDPAARSHDLYIVDVARGVRQRFTTDPSDERSAVWSADGRRVVYSSRGLDLYARASDFSGVDEPVEVTHQAKDPTAVSPDGQSVLYRQSGAGTGNDIVVVPLGGDRKPSTVLGSTFDETYADFSPDGKSIVYTSNESGRSEVYVMALEGGSKLQISSGGGDLPRWREGGGEIFFVGRDQMLTRVAVSGTGSRLTAGAPTPLFRMNLKAGPGSRYDVTADGQRFLVNTASSETAQPSLHLIVNWPSLLSRP